MAKEQEASPAQSPGLAQSPEPGPEQAVTKGDAPRPATGEDAATAAAAERAKELAALLPDLGELTTVLNMFKLKDRYGTLALSAEERQLRGDITASRAVYAVDQYVKLSEVRAIVADGLEAIHSRMVRTDELAKRTNGEVQNLASRVRTCVQQVNAVSKLKKGLDGCFHELREHELKLVDVAARESADV